MAELTWRSVASALAAGGALSAVRTCAYFASFLGALAYVLHAFPWRALFKQRPLLLLLVPSFSLTALVLTWRLILLFMVEFTTRYEAHPDPPNLFVEAYALVSHMPAGWWWSSSLLCWVTVASPVAHVEVARRRMPARIALAYICVAFLGAVSLAFPLLFAHLLSLAPRGKPVLREASASGRGSQLWPMCVGAALAAIVAMPLSVHDARPVFILALVIVHVVLALPYARAALTRPKSKVDNGATAAALALSPGALRVLAGLTAALHLYATASALTQLRSGTTHESFMSLARDLVGAAASNVCQASIAIDAALSSVAGIAFMLLSAEPDEIVHASACCLLSPFIGPAAGLALFCARRAERDGAAPRKSSTHKADKASASRLPARVARSRSPSRRVR